jgi:AcrR family transcriptional regulator
MPRVQEERSAETRRKLLDATVECLHEYGYVGTTTTEIARRAGVSRGAQLHHFHRKQDLVVSALEHVFSLRLEQFRQAAVELPVGLEARVNALIDLLWSAFKGATFYAWLELVVASRTDPALREAVRIASEDFAQGVHRVFAALFGLQDSEDYVDDPIEFAVFGLLESLALEYALCDSAEEERRKFEPAIAYVKTIANFVAREAARSAPARETEGESERRDPAAKSDTAE